jgi:hypothetical protein
MCSDGRIPAYLGQYVRSCSIVGQSGFFNNKDKNKNNNNFLAGCPPSYVCSLSNRPGYNVCCHPQTMKMHSPAAAVAVVPFGDACESFGTLSYWMLDRPLECSYGDDGDGESCPEVFLPY